MDEEECVGSIKIIIAGTSGVGKTSVVHMFINGTFDESPNITIAVDFKNRNIKIDDKLIKLSLWDTAGQERFRSIAPNFYRNTHGAIIMYDITNYNTFLEVEKWLNEIFQNCSERPCLVIVGNKADLSTRKVQPYEGKKLAEKFRAQFIETSAKNITNIDLLFNNLAREIMSKPDLWKPSETGKIDFNIVLKNHEEATEKSTCCLKTVLSYG